MKGLFYQLSNIIINTKCSCVARQGTIDGLVRVSDPKSQRKNVPTLTRTLNPKQEGWDYHSLSTTVGTEPREELTHAAQPSQRQASPDPKQALPGPGLVQWEEACSLT